MNVRIFAAAVVLAVTIGSCLPVWLSQSGSPYPAYAMATAGVILLIIFMKPRKNHG